MGALVYNHDTISAGVGLTRTRISRPRLSGSSRSQTHDFFDELAESRTTYMWSWGTEFRVTVESSTWREATGSEAL